MHAEKPYALTKLHMEVPTWYRTLQEDLDIPGTYELILDSVDAVSADTLAHPMDIGAIVLRKLQLLRRIAGDSLTRTDIVIGLCADLVRSLDQLLPFMSSQAQRTAGNAIHVLIECTIATGELASPSGPVELF